MIKPIFVIRLNKDTSREIRTSVFANMNLEMPDLFLQYHVIFASGESKHIEFECYNIEDIPEDVRKRTNGLIMDIIAKQSF
jgi:hypothetical protein